MTHSFPPAMSSHVFLFTKPAVPGRVKTRLVGALDATETARLHRAFVGDLATRLRRSERFALEVAWALEDGEVPPEWPELAGLPWHRQRGAGLGDRLFSRLAQGASAGGAVAAVGSDHPELPLEIVDSAFHRLEQGADLAIGPAEDGGYYLIALRAGAVRPELFEGIAWSTDQVRTQTLEKAQRLSLVVEELPMGRDVDLPADLEGLAQRLVDRPEEDCPRTRRVLEELGWLPERAP